jgi:hypothetical protein
MIAVIRKLWNGEYSLPVTFWGFYVGVSILSLLAAIPILLASYRLNVSVYSAIAAIRLVFLILVTVGVWRSAGHSIASPIWMSRFWGVAARVVVTLWLCRVVWINAVALMGAQSN